MNKPIINIGILAHVDAGKTTLTENLLYKTGAIRSKGSVDSGSAVTDNLEIERKRGISIRSAATSFEWEGIQFNLIDTPGHADFSAEVERCLAVLDVAILVVSAVEGVQGHTYSLWDALQSMNIPTLVVVNKLDRQGADYLNVLEELQAELQMKIFPLQASENDGLKDAAFVNIWEHEADSEIKNIALENLSDLDEDILEKYLEGESLALEDLKEKIRKYSKTGNLVPVLGAIAKEDIGTEEILKTLRDYYPSKEYGNNTETSALVFKIEHDKTLGRLAHIKVFGGTLKSRDVITNVTQQTEEKVAQLKKVFAHKLESIQELLAGDVGVISGLSNVMAGDILGNAELVPKQSIIQHPVLTVQVRAVKEEQYAALAEALSILNAEDPTMDFTWYKEDKELHLKLMGAIQFEIIKAIIMERFGIDTEFSDPTVIYKETPSTKAEGFVRYWMPKPCWAICTFEIEPGELNSGLVYESKVSVDKIARKYQNEIEQTIPKALQQGIKGWEVSDLKITLIDGEDHQVHSNPGDFILATPMGIMNGLKNTDTSLLEPFFYFEIKASEELLGAIASDLTNRRAVFANPEFANGKFILKGKTPIATSLNLSTRLHSITGGKGKIKLSFGGYQKCSDEQGVIREFKGVNPLDESQWILHKRGAFKADERKF
ncbi:MAG: TetM/TetW/TetO/TetS family tetracycline resistance ribosomal protection protein [Salinivirgaceae bacterium]|nr:TetM/TetW/TetO/TetS family tetracycline resistance ribosomal protection protein [Salinivirgaceae bacterium]